MNIINKKMESILVLPRDSFICSICDELLENPFECNSCNNLFCEECIRAYLDTKDKYRRLYFCPLCRNKKNNFCENSKINDLIENFKQSDKRMCKKCQSILTKDKFKSHISICWYKCTFCHLLFSNETKFLEHFSKNENHELIKALTKFNRKANSNIGESNKKSAEQYGKIKREKFENNLPKNEDMNKENSFNLVSRNGFNNEYNLYFCGNNNGINCECCVQKICCPDGEICSSCMKKNLKFHNLKSHYLINKKGRACKYKKGNYHCYSQFEEIKKDKGGNYFKVNKICSNENTCEACKYITELMNYYLPTSYIKKLIERDSQYSLKEPKIKILNHN